MLKRIRRFLRRWRREYEFQKWARQNKTHWLPGIKILRRKEAPPWAR